MSHLEDRLRHSLTNLTSDIGGDMHDLEVVVAMAEARHRRTVRRNVVVLVLVVVAAIALMWNRNTGGERVEPIGPIQTPTGTPGAQTPNPFEVVDTADLPALGLRHPLAVAVAPDGSLYVSDSSEHIAHVSPAGRVLQQWGGAGSRPGRFRLDSGALAVGRDGRVYVADTGNFRVQVFSPEGRFLTQYGSYGRGPGRFMWPSGIVVSRDGTMYVADDRAATVTAVAPGGGQLWRVGELGTTDPDLVGHEHLGDVDAAGRLVMANDDAGRVVYLDRSGTKVTAFGTGKSGDNQNGHPPPGGDFPDGACGATTDASGDVYVNSCEEAYQPRHETEVYDARHHLVGAWHHGPLIDSPVFGPTGDGYALTSEGALLRVRIELP